MIRYSVKLLVFTVIEHIALWIMHEQALSTAENDRVVWWGKLKVVVL